MLTDEELGNLLADPESDRVERKRSASDTARIAEAICAFANDLPRHGRPGVVFIGVEDDSTCADLVIDDRLLLKLSHLRDNGSILPFPVMSVESREFDGCPMAVIVVEPSDNPPVRYDNRCWIRVGPRRAQATAEDERRLTEKRRWGDLPFDMHGVPGAAIDDLDMPRFETEFLPASVSPEILEENRRNTDKQMRALRLLARDGTPTVTAILFLAKDVRQWRSGAYIQFVRYDGTAVTDTIKSQSEVSGTVVDQLRLIEEIMTANISTAMTFAEGVHLAAPDYPLAALQQLVRNAVLHRSYEQTNAPVKVTWFRDRIEISSPGGPFGQVTQENFGQPGVADYRNPTVAGALKAMGFAERFGMGIAIARKALADNGNPQPDFTVDAAYVLATIRPAR